MYAENFQRSTAGRKNTALLQAFGFAGGLWGLANVLDCGWDNRCGGFVFNHDEICRRLFWGLAHNV
jgi:hypothetical protein